MSALPSLSGIFSAFALIIYGLLCLLNFNLLCFINFIAASGTLSFEVISLYFTFVIFPCLKAETIAPSEGSVEINCILLETFLYSLIKYAVELPLPAPTSATVWMFLLSLTFNKPSFA
ncbi:MAG: hypothetical protein AAB788_02410 [Patescibacteria group bacterium]